MLDTLCRYPLLLISARMSSLSRESFSFIILHARRRARLVFHINEKHPRTQARNKSARNGNEGESKRFPI